jgi:hypothetical protein
MSRTRRGANASPPARLIFSDDLSFNSGSEEMADQYVAYFSKQKDKPALTYASLSLKQRELIFIFPTFAFEINALAYYYGLFEPEDHLVFDPKLNHLFCFFKPEELQLSRPEIAAYRDDLKKYFR